ncbi:MAG: hypothetical protein ACYSUT_08160 [Planctomycetota bacterium]
MKKVWIVMTVACVLFMAGCKKKPSSLPPGQPRQAIADMVEEGDPQTLGDQPVLPPADQLGEKVTFELAYRSITGKEDDVTNVGGYGFGSSDENNLFINEVRKHASHNLYISRNHYLKERPLTAIEYKGQEVLHAYFDLNADWKLSADEVLSPAKVSEQFSRGGSTVFMTPDFMVNNKQGQPTPFSAVLWVHFYSKKPNVTWGPIGLYEGTTEINGKSMQLRLFPNFSSKSYTEFSRSRYSLVTIADDSKHYMRNTFSSIIVKDSTFYRMVVEEISPLAKTIKVSLIEDKSPRGKISLDIQGKEDFEYKLTSSRIRGSEDKTIYFSIGGGMNELPVGNYNISYGSFQYGKEIEGQGTYNTSFRNVPAFAVKTDEEATIPIGQPTVNIQAVELNKRYHGDKKYKTEFPEGTDIYIDAAFVGMADETYSSFRQWVKKEHYNTYEDMKARIKIADGKGNEIANEELEYG